MKIFGNKISKGNILLFLSFTAISICLLLVVSATRAEKTVSQSQNGLYSGHQKGFSVQHSEEDTQWETVIPELVSNYDDFALYLPLQDPEIVIRGICVKGEVEVPPMLEGKYFEFSSSWTDRPTLVIGKEYRKDVHRKNGKMYYSYQGVNYEVIGIMGTEEDSRMNHMMMMDIKSALRIEGINGEYVLDTKKESLLPEIGQDVKDSFQYPAEVLILLDEGTEMSLVARFLSSSAIMDTMYVMILVSFLLSTILVTFIWLYLRRSLFFAWTLCGFNNGAQRLEIAKRYYLVSGIGFVVGLLVGLGLSYVMPDIHIIMRDVLLAFAMTIGLGTVILFICYYLNRRHV